MNNLDLWNAFTLGMTSLFAGALLYLWTAIALAAVFRKSGEAGWKAWVPILNAVVFLRLAGLSGWLVLLFFIPIAGWVCLIVAAHRINVAFGYGAGMTVLAALLFPVWATVLGFGAARWVGRERAAARGPVRASSPLDIPPAPRLPGSPPVAPPAAYAVPAHAPSAAAPRPPAGGWTPPPLPATAASVAAGSAAARSAPVASRPAAAAAPAPALPTPASPTPTLPTSIPPAPPAPATAAVAPMTAGVRGAGEPAPASLSDAEPLPDEPGHPDSAWSAAAPRRTGESGEPSHAEPRVGSEPPSWDFDFGSASATSEVTDAVFDAPAPISAIPMRAVPPAEPTPAADEGGSAPEPPVTSVPTPAPARPVAREPWAPALSPDLSEGEAFPESSGPVSAILGAPDAGSPRSARGSVSALHSSPHVPDEDEIGETVVARRKRIGWTLVSPSGARVPLTGDTVIVGRRPAADADFPDAQLVTIDDETRTVSKTHARLELRDGAWYICDLGSTNGVLFATPTGGEIAATPGEATEAGERFLLGDAEVSLDRSDA